MKCLAYVGQRARKLFIILLLTDKSAAQPSLQVSLHLKRLCGEQPERLATLASLPSIVLTSTPSSLLDLRQDVHLPGCPSILSFYLHIPLLHQPAPLLTEFLRRLLLTSRRQVESFSASKTLKMGNGECGGSAQPYPISPPYGDLSDCFTSSQR